MDSCSTPHRDGEARLRGRCLPCLSRYLDTLESGNLASHARALLDRAAEVPPAERWRAMVEVGLIDEDGRVLIGGEW